jgi:2-isopropylmalate synthase
MSPRPPIELYDTTLRDGTQMEGISLSVTDKLKIAQRLDEIGVHYIEGGWPGSNPKDAEFFARASELKLRNAKLTAFGSTRKAGTEAERDPNLRALVAAKTEVVTIVGKAHDQHVTRVLETTLEENLAMLGDSVRFLKSKGLRVFYDAEHFFDGFESNREYALQCLKTTANAGVDGVVLCDTNGGMIPSRLAEIVKTVIAEVPVDVGIHTHNGADVAVANSLVAVEVGAKHVQGAANGYGDMCGNANMFSIIANLKLKMGYNVVTEEQLRKLTEVSHFVSEIANITPYPRAPYVGAGAFSHKAGLHASAVVKEPWSYQHVRPEAVGNDTRFLVSELSGRRNLAAKLAERGVSLDLTDDEMKTLLDRVKELENEGWLYEGADASFEMLARRVRPAYTAPFELVDFWVVERKHHGGQGKGRARRSGEMVSEAMVKVRVGEELFHTAAEGNGPVNALDTAVRKALVEFYPDIRAIHLIDYKVRIIDSASATAAKTRVLIDSTDGEDTWTTVGSSTDIIEASWLALADSLEYWLVRRGHHR